MQFQNDFLRNFVYSIVWNKIYNAKKHFRDRETRQGCKKKNMLLMP